MERKDLPLVSIIIPTYNHAAYLPCAIRSCLNQSHPHQEIIVVDDGSTDETREILQPFKKAIIYLCQNNRGVSTARNAGLELATGDFITFLDADDYLTEDSIEVRLKAFFENSDIGFVMGETLSKHLDKEGLSCRRDLKKAIISNKFYEDLLLKRLTLGPALIRSSLAKKFRFPIHITNGEDIAYFAKILFSAKGCFLPVPVAVITRHSGGQHRDIEKITRQGVDLISTIFDDPYYGGALEYLRRDFSSDRYLSLFRSLYLYGDAQVGIKYYLMALTLKPKKVLKFGYLTKFIRAYLQSILKGAN